MCASATCPGPLQLTEPTKTQEHSVFSYEFLCIGCKQLTFRGSASSSASKQICTCFLFLFQNGNAAASFAVAEQYVSAFSNLAKESNTILLPSNTGDVTGMVTQVITTHIHSLTLPSIIFFTDTSNVTLFVGVGSHVSQVSVSLMREQNVCMVVSFLD